MIVYYCAANSSSSACCVDVGFFNSGGLDVSSNWGDYHNDTLGVSAARKFDC